MELEKVPGVSETLDWVSALLALDRASLDLESARDTMGVVLKAREDVEPCWASGWPGWWTAAIRSAAG